MTVRDSAAQGKKQAFRCLGEGAEQVSGTVPWGILLDGTKGRRQDAWMGRPRRTQVGGLVCHVLNRANGRSQFFADAGDYAAFVRTLVDAQAELPRRLLFDCVMPNHWHLVKRAEDWPWGSLWQRQRAEAEDRPELDAGPVPLTGAWTDWVNAPQTSAAEEAIRRCARRGQPFGTAAWVTNTVKSYGLQSTQRRPGRPSRPSHPGQLLLFEENGS